MKILIISDKTLEGYFAAESLTRGLAELFPENEIMNTPISANEFLSTTNYKEYFNKFGVDQIFILTLSLTRDLNSCEIPIPVTLIDNHSSSLEIADQVVNMQGNLVTYINPKESVLVTVEHFLQYLRANKDRIGKPQLPHFWQTLLSKYVAIEKDKFATTAIVQILDDYVWEREVKDKSVLAKLLIIDQNKLSMEYISDIRKGELEFIEKAKKEFEIISPFLNAVIIDVARLASCKVSLNGKHEEIALMMDCNNSYRYFVIAAAMKYGRPLIVRRDLQDNQYLLIIHVPKETKISAYEVAKELSENRAVHGHPHSASCIVTKNKIDSLFTSNATAGRG